MDDKPTVILLRKKDTNQFKVVISTNGIPLSELEGAVDKWRNEGYTEVISGVEVEVY